ncbi:unnamed protein product [Effrenium voratum]|nr:unnamed protein product [Effrenium voratum]
MSRRRACACGYRWLLLCLLICIVSTLLLMNDQLDVHVTNLGTPLVLPEEEADEVSAERAEPDSPPVVEEEPEPEAKAPSIQDEEELAPEQATEKPLLIPREVPAVKTLLDVYKELCHMGLTSPGSIRLAPTEVRDVVVKLYQPLVERQPPAPFHRERMVPLKPPDCKDPAWKHLLDGTRRSAPRAVVDVTTGMGGGPELDLLELRLWESRAGCEINASLSHLKNPGVKAHALLKNDNATSFLYSHKEPSERRLGYTVSDGPTPAPRTARHMLTMFDVTKDEVMDILRVATAMKESRRHFMNTGFDRFSEILKGCSLLTLFEKPSLRTRVSLECGMNQLGGQAIFYSIADSPLGAKESIEDTGRVLSRMCQGITARVMSRKGLRSLAQVSSIPVINALDDYGHPMQMMADLLTIFEHKGALKDFTMAYMGDLENNVTYDLMRTAALMGYNMNMAGAGEIEKGVWKEVNAMAEKTGAKVQVLPTAKEAITGVDAVYCDSWMSYGIPKDEEEARKKLFMPFQVTTDLMKFAKPDAIFMNCLPAARGMEQTAEVIDGPQSVVFDQAENRLHAQKALLVFLIAPQRFSEIVGVGAQPGRSLDIDATEIPWTVHDLYVISESAYGLRGDVKPLHFTRQRQRFKDFLPQVEHILLDNCSKYSREIEKLRQEKSSKRKKGGTMFSAEGIQRLCVLKTLIQRRPTVPDDALVIFSDLDEVPSAKAIQMLRVCQPRAAAKEGPWIQMHYPMPYNLRVGCKRKTKSQMHFQGVFATMGFLRRKKSLALRYNIRKNLIVPNAGIHLTYVGSRADVDYKLLHHGAARSWRPKPRPPANA